MSRLRPTQIRPAIDVRDLVTPVGYREYFV